MSSEATNFLTDLATLYLEEAKKAHYQLKRCKAAEQPRREGEVWAWYCALSLLQEQAIVFDIAVPSLEQVALEKLLR